MRWSLHTRSNMVKSAIYGLNLCLGNVCCCANDCQASCTCVVVGHTTTTLELLRSNGKVCQASVGNVIPYHGTAVLTRRSHSILRCVFCMLGTLGTGVL